MHQFDFDCYQYPHHYTTYTGKRYAGIIVDLNDENETSYIVPTAKFAAWKGIMDKDSRKSFLLEYCKEVKDPKSIVYQERINFDVRDSTQEIDWGLYNSKDFQVSKLIVFGAGASYGCSFDNKLGRFQPPMVDAIFDERFRSIYSNYPSVVNSISNFRRKAINGIELLFQKEWERIDAGYVPELLRNHINLQFYLRDLFKTISKEMEKIETNVYDVFFYEIQNYLLEHPKERISIVTFNYDTIVEKSLERIFGYNFNNLEDYISPLHRIHLYKLHGSSNWGWNVQNFNTSKVGKSFANYLFQNKIDLSQLQSRYLLDDLKQHDFNGIKVNSRNAKLRVTPIGAEDYPAILIPYSQKDEFVVPPKHLRYFLDQLDSVTDMYLIGWKGNEVVFNNTLKQKLGAKKITVKIANPNHGEVVKNLSEFLPSATWEQYKSFSDLSDNVLRLLRTTK